MSPRPVLVLGWAGALPFVVLTLAAIAGRGSVQTDALAALAAYGGVILSFMGGVQWGLQMGMAPEGGRIGYAMSVLPALAGFAAVLLPPRGGLPLLGAGFLALLAYDLRRSRDGVGPAWYPALRKPLTAAVVASLMLALAFAPPAAG
ncbi:DUF3429 domain-containing protein [Rhodoblastus sp.]|uniref:DUF3429 domain-containing protein n=1 Tax=Rhodoblastus sp. TaxID=1962975 RepID=UPI00262C2E4B|nr:DUF3429 domain-containing protein [Rhodoblastus sp.]